ncbi:MAG: transketolase, partial [Gemmatimonadales bacterium]|nr:transketolase [Gemmatimonadales bacterium]NIN13368.1 transketolase [Gemmatimonadales bacterium]NIN51371.1 transketolase [Gemmatimonadales bacterium]NIP08835.1 transketolase [Gemmatimonadales bacterium]NIQ99829.1 transketolase [Gemmatimonadales bacterium]
AYGWQVQRVEDGNDLAALDRATTAAKQEAERPSLVIVRTHIAYGSPNKQDTAEAHGAPLGEEEVKLTKENLGWPYEEPFTVPETALAEWRRCIDRGTEFEAEWELRHQAYAATHPNLAEELDRRLRGVLAKGWEDAIPRFTSADGPMATRVASGKVLNAVVPKVPELLGGSADLTPSNNTLVRGAADLSAAAPGGRNMHFGIREHGMGAVLTGMALHGGIIPFGGTFLVFSDYMRPPIRLASMMGLKVIYVFTHDSIGLGEDGPTHQPIEMLPALRAIPNFTVIRPGDAAETAEAWRVAIKHQGGPVALVLTRQKVPSLDRTELASAEALARGGYVLSEAAGGTPQVILMASGSELSLILEAKEQLEKEAVPTRVVSMPSLDLFAAQPAAYRDEVLPPGVRVRLAVEAAQPMSWYQWVGDGGGVLGIEKFGASAPYKRLLEEYGFSTENIVARVRELVAGER